MLSLRNADRPNRSRMHACIHKCKSSFTNSVVMLEKALDLKSRRHLALPREENPVVFGILGEGNPWKRQKMWLKRKQSKKGWMLSFSYRSQGKKHLGFSASWSSKAFYLKGPLMSQSSILIHSWSFPFMNRLVWFLSWTAKMEKK